MIPTDEQVEAAARIIEPQAWRALGMCDTLAYENRRKSSLRKARAALSAVLPQAVADEREAIARDIENLMSACPMDDEDSLRDEVYGNVAAAIRGRG